MSPRRNWDSPNPSAASECALLRLRARGVPIPTTGEKAQHSAYSVVGLFNYIIPSTFSRKKISVLLYTKIVSLQKKQCIFLQYSHLGIMLESVKHEYFTKMHRKLDMYCGTVCIIVFDFLIFCESIISNFMLLILPFVINREGRFDFQFFSFFRKQLKEVLRRENQGLKVYPVDVS